MLRSGVPDSRRRSYHHTHYVFLSIIGTKLFPRFHLIKGAAEKRQTPRKKIKIAPTQFEWCNKRGYHQGVAEETTSIIR